MAHDIMARSLMKVETDGMPYLPFGSIKEGEDIWDLYYFCTEHSCRKHGEEMGWEEARKHIQETS